MEVTRLTAPQVKQIYRAHLQKDFPPEETKPLSIIIKAMYAGTYECFSLTDPPGLLGYAFFVRHGSHYLLDYLAILPEKRGQGLGSAFLGLLKERLASAESILAEVEDPGHTISEECRAQRERRLRFYRRCSFRDTGVTVRTFGVDYRLIEMPRGEETEPERVRRLYALHYRAMLPGFLYRKMIRF